MKCNKYLFNSWTFVFPEPNVLAGTLVAHTDAVWGLAYSGVKNHLLSCSADGTIRLWNPPEKMPCICTYNGEKGKFFSWEILVLKICYETSDEVLGLSPFFKAG